MDNNGKILKLIDISNEVVLEYLTLTNEVGVDLDFSKPVTQVTNFTCGMWVLGITCLLSIPSKHSLATTCSTISGISIALLPLPLGGLSTSKLWFKKK